MLRIGLTGGIGAGKSTVAACLRDLGAVVADADEFAREVVAPGSAGLAAVVEEFGAGVLAADGSLDRAALGALVFSDADRRRALERITHPLVAQRTAEVVAASPADAIVVHDVPLIVEKSMGGLYHLVVVVDAPEQVRVRRLGQSRGMSEAEARARILAQAGPEQRWAAADVWCDTDRPRAAVAADVRALWEHRLVPFEHNVRTASRVRRPDDLQLHPYDPQWPLQAARLLQRVRHAAGALGVAGEHIGSTAVPGLAAKPVLDLMLGVRSLDDADVIRDELSAAGFPPVAGHDQDTVVPEVDADPQAWRKRFHGGADPALYVHLHVREVDGPGWRTALLLRDWWRSDPDERAAYARAKDTLRGRTATATEYAEAKEPWMAQAVVRSLDWARTSGWRPTS